jgi:hypothetical protein
MSKDVILTIICVLFACLAATALWALRKERHRNCRLYEQFHEACQGVYTMGVALRLSAEYAMLPAVEGWAWYEALCKYAPEELKGYPDYTTPAKVTVDGDIPCSCGRVTYRQKYHVESYCALCRLLAVDCTCEPVNSKMDHEAMDESGSAAKAKKFFESFD